MSAETSRPPSETPPPAPAVPFLRRVRIRGYKSIESCDVTLSPLTILVGRNASGKSNFIDALSFLRDLIALNLEEAVKRHGGPSSILCRTKKDRTIHLEVEYPDQSIGGAIGTATYGIKIEFPLNLAAKITSGYVAFKAGDVWSRTWHDGTRFYYHDHKKPEVFPTPAVSPLARLTIDPRTETIPRFSAIHLYNFFPSEIRLLRHPNPGYFLEPTGSNLASAIETMRQCDEGAFGRLKRYLNAVAHSIELSGRTEVGGFETVTFRVTQSIGNAIEFNSASMSDGTLRALAALTAVFQSVPDLGAPSLVAIEEPETALHPAAMRALVAAFDEATARTQIILTTHSPDLLDCEAIGPENIRVVEMIDGKTVIGPVDRASKEIVRQKLMSLGELERQDQLERGPVPASEKVDAAQEPRI